MKLEYNYCFLCWIFRRSMATRNAQYGLFCHGWSQFFSITHHKREMQVAWEKLSIARLFYDALSSQFIIASRNWRRNRITDYCLCRYLLYYRWCLCHITTVLPYEQKFLLDKNFAKSSYTMYCFAKVHVFSQINFGQCSKGRHILYMCNY